MYAMMLNVVPTKIKLFMIIDCVNVSLYFQFRINWGIAQMTKQMDEIVNSKSFDNMIASFTYNLF